MRDGKGKTVTYVGERVWNFPSPWLLSAPFHFLVIANFLKMIYSTKFVDFWDTRDAEKACEEATGKALKGGVLEARFALQTGRYATSNIILFL